MYLRKHILSPLLGCRTRDYLAMLAEYGVHPTYYPRAVVTCILSLCGAPLRLYEKAFCPKGVRTTRIKTPLFILGFWRSGTTYLHNLLACDPALGYIDQYQTFFPHSAVTNRLTRRLMRPMMPKTRPMDRVKVGLSRPQEDGMAMAITNRSYYTSWYFSNHERRIVDAYGTFRKIEDSRLKQWKQAYLVLLQKATYLAGGRRLVMKDPSAMGRIPVILEMFPDARFVHIARDPYAVFHSTKRLYEKARPYLAHHKKTGSTGERVIETYAQIVQRYLEQRSLIAQNHLVDIRYEDLLDAPDETVESIYRGLEMDRSADAVNSVRAFIDARKSYQPMQYPRDDVLMARLRKSLSFAFEAFGY